MRVRAQSGGWSPYRRAVGAVPLSLPALPLAPLSRPPSWFVSLVLTHRQSRRRALCTLARIFPSPCRYFHPPAAGIPGHPAVHSHAGSAPRFSLASPSSGARDLASARLRLRLRPRLPAPPPPLRSGPRPASFLGLPRPASSSSRLSVPDGERLVRTRFLAVCAVAASSAGVVHRHAHPDGARGRAAPSPPPRPSAAFPALSGPSGALTLCSPPASPPRSCRRP